MLNTKNIIEYLKCFVNVNVTITGIKIPNNKNSFNQKEILQILAELKIRSFYSLNIIDALEKISKISSKKSNRILICGSLYLAGYILKENK